MKKLLAVFVAAVVGVTSTFTAASSKAFAEAVEIDASMTQEEFIEEADEYVEVTDDGFIELELPDELIDELSPEEYEQMQAGIAAINEAVESGELAVTPNGTIYETEDDELVVQGGNVDDVQLKWWGLRRYAPKNNAAAIARNLNNGSYIISGISAVSVCCGPVGMAYGFTLLFAGTIRAQIIANDINYYNALTNRGVIIDLYWLLGHKVRCQ